METNRDYLIRRISPEETLEALCDFPRYFEIETVNACNAACPMCTIADWQRQPQVMKDDLFEKIAAEICEHKEEVKRVRLFRDGEPLLDKKLGARIRRLKDGGCKSVGISTNAQLLDRDKAESILWAGLDEIFLSIDSLVKDTYDKIRVGLDFETVRDNCVNFFKVRDWAGSDCKIRVRMIRQEANQDEWDDFENFWKFILGPNDTVEYKDIHNWGGALDLKTKGETERACVALWSLMVVFADGSVPLCNVDYNNKYPLGNVRDHTIQELWRSDKQNLRRKQHLFGCRAAIPPCTNCTVWSENARTEAA